MEKSLSDSDFSARLGVPRSRTRLVRLSVHVLLCVMIALWASLALAFDKEKAAAKMAQQASAAYESGDYERAAELYGSAFHTDPNPDYLYAQARAEQVGGKPDLAATHLQAVIANTQATPERVTKAKELLEGLQQARLNKEIADGESAARNGDYKLAAQIWQDVARRSPKRVDLVYRSGVALQQAGDLRGALAIFDSYLQTAPSDALDVTQARARREALAEKLRPAASGGAVADPTSNRVDGGVGSEQPGTIQRSAESASSPLWGYVLAGTGVALVVGGGILYGVTQSDVSAFKTATTADANGKILGTDLRTATDQHASIQTREVSAIVMGGAGLALAGVGTWLILTTPNAKVTWVPGPTVSGAGLAWRF